MVDRLVICLIDKIHWNSIESQAKVHESSTKFLKSKDTLWNSMEIHRHSVEAVNGVRVKRVCVLRVF